MADRLEQLRRMLEKSPDDAFLWYALALELRKAGELAAALSALDKVLGLDGNYLYAYYQRGQIAEELDDVAAAMAAYEAGIKRASALGDMKALGELKAALAVLA